MFESFDVLLIQSVLMEEFYSKNKQTTTGPSDLTIKRILAFSKALDVSKPLFNEDKNEIKKEE